MTTLVIARHIAGPVEIENRVPFRPKQGSLISRWQKTGVPVEWSPFDPLIVAEYDVAGKILIFTSQSVIHPRTRSGKSRTGDSRIDLVQGRYVIIGVAVQRLDKSEVIHMFCNVGISVTDPGTTFPVLLERKRGFHEWTGIAIEDIDLDLLPVPFCQFRLGIEHIDGTRSTFHEEPDHRSGFCGKVSVACGEGIHRA